MLLKLAALALLPAATLATESNSAMDCQLAYVQTSYGIIHKCEALVTFSKCLSAFPESSLMESMLMKNNAKDCEAYWKTETSPEMNVRRNNLQLTVDDDKDIKFYRHRREELSVFEMNKQIVSLQQLVGNLTTQLKSVNSNVGDLTTQLESVNSNVVNNVQAKLDAMKQDQDDTKKAMKQDQDDTKQEIEDAMDDLEDAVGQKVSKLTSDTNKALSTQSNSVLAQVDTKVKSLNASVSAVAVVAKAAKDGNSDKPVHMWSGGPKSSKYANGWHDLVMDRTDYDTAAPYFQKQTNTRFRALKSGLFKVDYNIRQYGSGHCWRHMRFFVNGKHINYEHHYVQSHFHLKYTATWHIKAGQQFWGRMYVSCGNHYVFEASSSWKGAPSRVQVEYVGQLEGKCASTVGLCP